MISHDMGVSKEPKEPRPNRWGSFLGGEEGYEELDPAVAYRIGLRTWANWVDSTLHPNQTQGVLHHHVPNAHEVHRSISTMKPTKFHSVQSSDWHGKKGMGCHRETKPVMEKGHRG
ncbi:hypothetical protein Taro_002844 [Colocasia esculenta]|uniref:Uncharacterized protein n=1 Tax=Colocasia esculenta TaxID=4460 RepID=A0A843TM58_COLES|nr:hypothetical protein [Colocasia esculenta]